jgi:histidinol-phosphate phosphatase family protein
MRCLVLIRSIFLDRDGTLIEDRGYVHKIKDLRFLPGVIEGLKILQKYFLFFIITNQSGIERGYYTLEDFYRFNNYFLNKLKFQGIRIEKTYFCPHINGCACKKPSIKYINDIVRLYEVELATSWVIGDHPSDIIMGKKARCRTVYLLTGHGKKNYKELNEKKIEPTIVAEDFLSATKYIIKNEN